MQDNKILEQCSARVAEANAAYRQERETLLKAHNEAMEPYLETKYAIEEDARNAYKISAEEFDLEAKTARNTIVAIRKAKEIEYRRGLEGRHVKYSAGAETRVVNRLMKEDMQVAELNSLEREMIEKARPAQKIRHEAISKASDEYVRHYHRIHNNIFAESESKLKDTIQSALNEASSKIGTVILCKSCGDVYLKDGKLSDVHTTPVDCGCGRCRGEPRCYMCGGSFCFCSAH